MPFLSPLSPKIRIKKYQKTGPKTRIFRPSAERPTPLAPPHPLLCEVVKPHPKRKVAEPLELLRLIGPISIIPSGKFAADVGNHQNQPASHSWLMTR